MARKCSRRTLKTTPPALTAFFGTTAPMKPRGRNELPLSPSLRSHPIRSTHSWESQPCGNALGFDHFRRRIPGDWLLAEIRFVSHVAGDGGVIAKDRIFGHRLVRPHSLEERLQVRTHVVPVVAFVGNVLVHGFFAQRR